MLNQAITQLQVDTPGPGLTDLTVQARLWLEKIDAIEGLLTVFIRHTSASLVIQENADPDVRVDLETALDVLAPRSAAYQHTTEGADDMPAHIKSMLTSTSIGIPVTGGLPVLGRWQALYLVEHRDQPHRREVVLHFVGELAAH
jgi:secondary thiamine-phosphate synthase enzyme